MEEGQYFIKLAGIIFGATGVWKVIELLFKTLLEKRLKSAETKNLNVQAEAQIVGNWINWSQHLEQRVKELEAVADENRKLKEKLESQRKMIESQKTRIIKLEDRVELLTKEKIELQKETKKNIRLQEEIKSLKQEKLELSQEIEQLKNDAA